MKTLKLQKMNSQQYENFLKTQTAEYAKEKISNGLWQEADAQQRASEEFESLLPNGLETYNNYLYVITDDQVNVYGYVWLADIVNYDEPDKKYLFIYNFAVLPKYQQQGIGRQAMKLVFQKAKDLDYVELGLHVFGNNKQAIHLYNESGFKTVDLVMKKKL